MLTFWSNVRNLLEYKDITQKELAACINVSYNTLQSWINKDRLPNVEQAVQIAKFLNTTVEFLVLSCDSKIKVDNTETINLLKKAIENLQ